ncbi:flagellin (plasmid) [Octadecabacter arcticus 238]|uniref:Flagellin n=1 Tax=Octadecabacter arcticus 238 TaxID=391616 RepID=M9RQ07_9RHOB|nr:flagellin [Octadecabacter arcticus]AGI74714.1 flagellin [Octadecabacter arcticus 238]
MGLSIATNTGALMASAAASSVNKDMETSMERLSTGKRINSASDDAAGVAIASRLTSEIRGTNQAIRNAQDGQALIDTAEGSHSEVENILQRMRELAVQAASDTNDTADRTNLQVEFDALLEEVDRISAVTTWAGQTLLDGSGGSAGAFTFQIGAGTSSSDTLTVTIKSLGSSGSVVTAGSSLSLASNGSAATAITAIDTSIANLNAQRAELGSASNRLDNTVANLTNVAINLEGGRGRIEDADFASESTSLAKSQILQQASTAMLAQANASKQNVLSLLQG